ncbi:MAG: phosphoglucosamine mutase [Thermoplasmata archaeon]|nr:phosphoglucosamine mutase [Thermoplasmata archaeon]
MTRLFGTNGIRWRPDSVGDQNFAVELGLAIGTYIGEGKTVCMGMDTRVTGPMIAAAVTSGILSTGCNIIDIGVVPTPTVQYGVKALGTDGGVVISASHNPPEFNGLKCIASDGTELAREEEEKIEVIYFSKEFKLARWDKVGRLSHNSETSFGHIDRIISLFKPNPDWKKLRVVIDCSNGPAGNFTPHILRSLGCEVLTINAQPDGLFPGRMPEPLEENLDSLMCAVVDAGADFGIAHDGDADRAIFIDEGGKYINGDESLAIFAIDALSKKKGKVVVPVNTSRVVTDSIVEGGGEVELTPIGSPIIARRMGRVDAVFGGEGNGGAIFPENMLCRDGMMTAAKMVEILATGDRSLGELIAGLPSFVIKRSKFSCPDQLKGQVLVKVREAMADSDIIDIDGVKIEGGDWWVLFRPSGTEPVFRVTAEAGDGKMAEEKLNQFKKLVEDIIQDLS